MPRTATTGMPVTNEDGSNSRMTAAQMDAIGQFSSSLSSELDRNKTQPANPPRLETDSNVQMESAATSVKDTAAGLSTYDEIEIRKPIIVNENNDTKSEAISVETDADPDAAHNTRRKRGPDVKIETLEIDMESPKAFFDVEVDDNNEYEDDDDDEIARDMERLLVQTSQTSKHAANTNKSTSTSSSSKKTSSSSWFYCCFGSNNQQQLKRRRIGNTSVVFPAMYQKTGWGIVGPHWFGPPSVLLLLVFASSFFIQRATTIGPITSIACIGFTVVTAYNLCNAAFRDPGIVLAEDQHSLDLTNYRWCDFCNVYQPPDGAHCPDCNVCVAGYDHHCVWMGTCIGRKNFRQFVAFNLSWLFYLGYAIVWVTFIGPAMYKKH